MSPLRGLGFGPGAGAPRLSYFAAARLSHVQGPGEEGDVSCMGRKWLSWWVIGACIVGMWLPGWVLPAIVGAVVVFEYLRALGRARNEMPERVASHFGFSLEADGWMSRRWYVRLLAGLGLVAGVGIPLVVSYAALQEGNPQLQRMAVWLIPMMTSLFWGLHELTVEANRSEPAKMPQAVWGLMGLFFVAINLWGLGVAVMGG